MKIALVIALACVSSASASGFGYGYAPAGTFLSHVPALDSAVVKSDRLGGNFAYSVQTQHAYAAHTPVVQHVATPVGVSYSAPAYGYAHARPAVALAQPVVAQQVAYARPAVAVGQQVAYSRPAVAFPQQVAYSRPAVALAQPIAQQVTYSRPATYGYAVAQPNIEGTINTPKGTIAYSGVGTSGAYNPPVQQIASNYVGGPAIATQLNNAYTVLGTSGLAGYNTYANGVGYANRFP